MLYKDVGYNVSGKTNNTHTTAMKLIKLQSIISNFAQDMADAMSADPEIKAARQAGLEKIKAAKDAEATHRREAREQRKLLKVAHKEERLALRKKQDAEFDLLLETQKISEISKVEAINSAKIALREECRDIRKALAAKVAKADAYVEFAPTMEDIVPPATA